MNVKPLACGLLLLLAALAGCGAAGPEPPKTYPVTGTVWLKKGQPAQGGLVELQPTTAAGQHTTNGHIGADGAFTVMTLAGNKKLEGAPEGQYRVTVTLTSQDQQNTASYQLPEPFTVKADGKNELVIDLSKLP
jgi:hypothetical protein